MSKPSSAFLSQVLRFGVVGCVGFAVDGGLLWILITEGADAYFARALSFPVAVLTTWWFNRIWTFDGSDRTKPVSQLRNYLTVQITGALCNYGIYTIYLGLFEPTRDYAMIGFALGSAVGMVVNFLGARVLVFKP